jgi:hypothetical protein
VQRTSSPPHDGLSEDQYWRDCYDVPASIWVSSSAQDETRDEKRKGV